MRILSEKRWGEIVNTMIKVYGAPIPPDVAKVIIIYLGSAYSGDKERRFGCLIFYIQGPGGVLIPL
ncbi:MAG: hypothetical protein EHM79_14970 [Geobacter sp.]|nr:MAG: hypothetical protein EHM79_14970 [Geobacter sp.]